mgnify:CR=1 FL=1
MNALKPCPFCGGEATENRDISNSIYCKKCFAEIDTDCVDWNIRPIEDAIRKRIAELEALVNVSEGLYERIYEQAARIAELEGKIASLKDKHYEMANELEGKRFFTDTLFYDIYRLQSRITELEAENDQLTADSTDERQDDKWIPVSERLPEDGEVVWLWDGKYIGMGYYLVFAGQFMDRDTPLRPIRPSHWMPLPESPNDTQTQTVVYRKESEE